ncbi:MAG TPA: hypothetical protein VFI31_25560 [Pirellulales bacterium]|nr:hypothetical protein [Pirellulales bacterium]
MALRSFLTSLIETGRAQVERPDAPLETLPGEANDLLAGLDRLARDQLAYTAPEFSLEVVRWAAELMYRGCQCLVYRELDESAVAAAFDLACPQPMSLSTVYSGDLVLRYLPELATMARAVAERDVLVLHLNRLGAAWPLSSVGIPQIAANQLDPKAVEIIMGDACLRQLYVDRIIARRDATRLEHFAVQAAVLEAIGLYDELWPEAGRVVDSRR